MTLADDATLQTIRDLYAGAVIKAEIWLGVDDRLPRKEVIDMSLKGQTPIVIRGIATFGDFDEPVEITPPATSIPLEELTAKFAGSASANANQELCFANQEYIESLTELYSVSEKGLYPLALKDLVPKYEAELPVCPDGGAYKYDARFGEVTCSKHGRYK